MSEDATNTIKRKFENLGILLLNFNIINITITNNDVQSAILQTQILDQKISEMEFIKNSKTLQLQYLTEVNKINDDVNKNNEITKGEVKKNLATGRGDGKALLYDNLAQAVTSIQTKTNNFDTTFLFVYLAIFKNTFNKNQNMYVNKNPY